MKDPFEKICQFFDQAGAEYKVLHHQPVITSQEAAAIDVPDHVRGIKSLLFQTDSSLVLLVITDQDKISSSKVRKLLQTENLRLVKPETVEQTMGCQIGGCYPLGPVCDLDMIIDRRVSQCQAIRFNAGRREISIQIDWPEFKRALDPTLADLVQ